MLEPTGATLDNDPLNQLRPGGGICYLNPGYEGFRAGRAATALIRQRLCLRQIRAAGEAFPPPLVGLPGIPTGGGFQTLDRAGHPVRADTVNGFMFTKSCAGREPAGV